MSNEQTIISLKEEIVSLENRIKKIEIKVKNGDNKQKKVKDPNMPKKYKTAYIFFNVERINNFKEKHPNEKINISLIAKESGELWKKIKEDEKKYEKYKKLEDRDKKRYKKEMEVYEKIEI